MFSQVKFKLTMSVESLLESAQVANEFFVSQGWSLLGSNLLEGSAEYISVLQSPTGMQLCMLFCLTHNTEYMVDPTGDGEWGSQNGILYSIIPPGMDAEYSLNFSSVESYEIPPEATRFVGFNLDSTLEYTVRIIVENDSLLVLNESPSWIGEYNLLILGDSISSSNIESEYEMYGSFITSDSVLPTGSHLRPEEDWSAVNNSLALCSAQFYTQSGVLLSGFQDRCHLHMDYVVRDISGSKSSTKKLLAQTVLVLQNIEGVDTTVSNYDGYRGHIKSTLLSRINRDIILGSNVTFNNGMSKLLTNGWVIPWNRSW